MTQNSIAMDDARLYRRIALRLLPLLMFCYLFSSLDRVNISFAKLQMGPEIGLSDAAYGFASSIFFLGYLLFEVPSNLLLVKIGARRTLGRILILWGLASAAMMFVTSPGMLHALRFLLGIFEAGFAPGVIFYLSLWFPEERRGSIFAVFLLAGPFGAFIGGPLSTAIMVHTDGRLGLFGWQWMFLLEGLPCALLGLYVLARLAENPQGAGWLSAEEKARLASRIKPATSLREPIGALFTNPRHYLLGLVLFAMGAGLYAVAFWLPTMLQEMLDVSLEQIGLLSMPPNALGMVMMVLVSRRSDRKRERLGHAGVPLLLSAVLLAAATSGLTGPMAKYVLITAATAAICGGYSVFWTLPARVLGREASAGGVALINSIGITGGLVSPWLMGWTRSVTGGNTAGLLTIAAMLAMGAGLTLVLAMTSPRSNTLAAREAYS